MSKKAAPIFHAPIFHRVTEKNAWEGETWYHYFLNGPDVLTTLESVCDAENTDLTRIETMSITWKEAEILTNQDDGDYMQRHWFGELTKCLKE